jgi:hypothetical protein
MSVTNAVAVGFEILRTFAEIQERLSLRAVAVVGDAGYGKTELAAEITAPDERRPPGLVLFGRDLRAGGGLDALVQAVVVNGVPVRNFERLLGAVDAAGRRAQRRLPIVIDGLNEAEDPREWKAALAAVEVVLGDYPYVLLVVTLRSEFVAEALPDGAEQVPIHGIEENVVEAVRRYFAYYKIQSGDAELPLELFNHPLTLRLFCEVTNPSRTAYVGIERMPGSLDGLFEQYLNQAARRIAELAPRSHRFYETNVQDALARIGGALWDRGTRTLGLAELRSLLDDADRPWDQSMVRALEQEGVLLRLPGDDTGLGRVQFIYDALAGHVVAEAILRRHGTEGFDEWLRADRTRELLSEAAAESHTLAPDVFASLVALTPRRRWGTQLWQLLEEPLRTRALLRAASLESALLDVETVEQIAQVLRSGARSGELLRRLRTTRGVPAHPLNADFLDRNLRPMAVSARDASWSEWLRRNADRVVEDLERLERQWAEPIVRSRSDRLRARWVLWTLTSTCRKARDQATRTLYWFGLGDPGSLFELCADACDINDLFVVERALGACYGVVMASQSAPAAVGVALAAMLMRLRDAFVGEEARCPTDHYLIRDHILGIVEYAATFSVPNLPDGLSRREAVVFARGPVPEPIEQDDERASEVGRAIDMDFANYTIGHLVDGRRNYDTEHTGYKAAIALVKGTIWELGWRADGLGVIDLTLNSSRSRHIRAAIERYGKKYSWIGFYCLAGQMQARARGSSREHRLADVPVDVSFPSSPPVATIDLGDWLAVGALDEEWLQESHRGLPAALLYATSIESRDGPWVLAAGYISKVDRTIGRSAYGFMTAMLVPALASEEITELLAHRLPERLFSGDIPADYYTYAGEIPWSDEFALSASMAEDVRELYMDSIEREPDDPIDVEMLAHLYGWESYHSELNTAGGAFVPSKAFSRQLNLHGAMRPFDQVLPAGNVASISLTAPAGFGGNLLYLRESALNDYAAGRELVWWCWGERQIDALASAQPDWVVDIYRRRANAWQEVKRLADMRAASGVVHARRPRRRRTRI